jgi:hypothetical protein
MVSHHSELLTELGAYRENTRLQFSDYTAHLTAATEDPTLRFHVFMLLSIVFLHHPAHLETEFLWKQWMLQITECNRST